MACCPSTSAHQSRSAGVCADSTGVPLQVYRGILNNSVPVAIKECSDDENQSAKKSFVEEIVCLMNLRHTNVSSPDKQASDVHTAALLQALSLSVQNSEQQMHKSYVTSCWMNQPYASIFVSLQQ